MQLKKIGDIDHIEGKRIIVRSDLNVPIENGHIVDDYRITRALPTLTFLTSRGAKIILLTHLGDDGSESLAPVAKALEEKKIPLAYIDSTDRSDIEKAAANVQNGNVLLLPNIRSFSGEKDNDKDFSIWLASLGEMYVNDAFSVSHREHASVVGIPKIIPGYAGMQFIDEIEHLSVLSENPGRPFAVLFGGAKLSTKIPLIKKLASIADFAAVGGALANQIYYSKGIEIGKSLHDEEKVDISMIEKNNVFVPEDVVVTRNGESRVVDTDKIETEDTIVDIGPRATEKIIQSLIAMKTVLWNGPMGKYEDGFGSSTEKILTALAENASATKATVGGGDTVALVSKLGLQSKLYFVSTGGGATLEFLEKGTLPGIKAL